MDSEKPVRKVLDRRSPSVTKLVITVTFLATIAGAVSYAAIDVLATDYRTRRDVILFEQIPGLTTRINGLENRLDRSEAKDEAWKEEVLRRFDRIERTLEKLSR